MNIFYITFLSLFIHNLNLAAHIPKIYQPLTLTDRCIEYLLFTKHETEPNIEILPIDLQEAIEIKSQLFLDQLIKNPLTPVKIHQFYGLLRNGFLINLDKPVVSSLIQQLDSKTKVRQSYPMLRELLTLLFATTKYDKNNAHLAVKIALERENKTESPYFFDIAYLIIEKGLHKDLSNYKELFSFALVCNENKELEGFIKKITRCKLSPTIQTKLMCYALHQYSHYPEQNYKDIITALLANGTDHTILSESEQKIFITKS